MSAPAGVPRWVFLPAALGALFVVLPLLAMLWRLEPTHLPDLLGSEATRAAFWLSLQTASASTALCLLVGVPLALVLARSDFRGLSLLRSLVLIPLVLPPVVGGLALLYTFGRRGLVGQWLEVAGVSVAFTTIAVVMAQTFVSLPFLVLSLEGALRSTGPRYDAVAASLGARPSMVLWQITLPLVAPGLISGSILAFARSLGEFGATLAFAGNLPGVTRTLPLEIFFRRETDPAGAVALSLLLVVIAIVVIGVARPVDLRR